jgi:vitamin B12 transporter
VNYAWLQSNKNSGEWISYYALDYLKHKLSAAVHFQVIKNLNITLQTNYQQRNGTYTAWDFVTATPLGEAKYKPFTTLSAKADYQLENTRFFVEANNLTNVKVVDFGNIPQAGLWIQGGVSIALQREKKM